MLMLRTAATVTDISTMRERKRRVPDNHALAYQRVRIRVPEPCRYQHLHLPFLSVCFSCWFIPRDPYAGREGVVRDWNWNRDWQRGETLFFEVWFDDGGKKSYPERDFSPVGPPAEMQN